MKNIYFVFCVLVLVGLSSCSSNSVKVTAADVEVLGDIYDYNDPNNEYEYEDYYSEDCFQIADGKYSIEFQNDELTVVLPVTITKDLRGKKLFHFEAFSVGLIDESGEVLKTGEGKQIELKITDQSMVNDLLALEVGEAKMLTFSGMYDKTVFEAVKSKVRNLVLGVEFSISEDEVSESENEIVITGEGTGKWDELLDDFEAFLDDYEKYVNKMKNGDVDTQSLSDMASKAMEMQENLNAHQSELTAPQIQRLTKISARITQIAAKVSTVNVEDIKSVGGVDLKNLGL